MARPAAWRPVVTEIVRERIDAGSPSWLPVHGRSMRPLLARGMRILVAPASRVRLGDLLAYECAGTIVCHRVIARRGATLFTRADHGGAEPERVERDQIVGVAVAVEHGGAVRSLTGPGRRAQAIVRTARSLAAAVWATAQRSAWRRA